LRQRKYLTVATLGNTEQARQFRGEAVYHLVGLLRLSRNFHLVDEVEATTDGASYMPIFWICLTRL